MRYKIIVAVIIAGLAGSIAQLLFIRELLIVFHGNEFSIGIVLANWLLLEGLGALLIGTMTKKAIHRIAPTTLETTKFTGNKNIPVFVVLQIVFSMYLPIAVFLIRNLKSIIGVMPAESLGLFPIFYSSFLLLLPASICHGALFPLSCKLYYSHIPKRRFTESSLQTARNDSEAIGITYVYEMLGSIIGSLVFSFLLIKYFDSFSIILAIMVLNFLISIVLLWRQKNLFSAVMNFVCIILFILSACIFAAGKIKVLQKSSIAHQFSSKNILYYKNSVYGNITVTRNEEQYSFLLDGVPLINIPTPDIEFVEDFVNFPLLVHPAPKSVLVISGGAGGVINKILEYPVKSVDYLELDPLLLSAIKKFPTPLTAGELGSPRVHIKYQDGRFFLRDKSYKTDYDLIFVGVSEPLNLQSNRFFTQEFFELSKSRLNPGGILGITLPGSLEYMNNELIDLNLCVFNTIKKVYPYARVIPGDFNIFLCSNSNISAVPDTVLKHLAQNNIESGLFTPEYIKYRLDSSREKWFLSYLSKRNENITNTDFHPVGVFYSLAYWNSLFNPGVKKLFNLLLKFNLRFFILLVFILTLCCFVGARLKSHIRNKQKNNGISIIIPFCIFTTGFVGMIFSLVLIFTFQSVYGYVFRQIGILTASFMTGGLVGSIIITSALSRIKRDYGVLILLELFIIFFSLIFVRLIVIPGTLIFILLSFIIGLLVSAEFPLANKIYLQSFEFADNRGVENSAGMLYWADLLGGWFAGIIAGIIMLPVLGLVNTCIAATVFKVGSLVVILSRKQ